MSIPRMNQASQGSIWVDSAPAATSFTTAIAVLHDQRAGIEVIYSGLDAADAYVRLHASNSGDATRARRLTELPATLTTANSSVLFNVTEMGYNFIHLEYDAGANTAGAVDVYLSRKQTS